MASLLKGLAYVGALVVMVGLLVWTFTLASAPLVLAIAAGVALLAWVGARRLSKRVQPGTVLELDLDAGVIESKGVDPLSQLRFRGATTLLEVVEALKTAEGDSDVIGLVARVGNGSIQVGHAQELRDAIHSFRSAGKIAIAYSESFGESGNATVDYYVASAFDKIVLLPGATASVHGVLGRGRFIRGALDKLGVVPDMGHRREYKAAMYTLTERSFTDSHRESVAGVAGEIFDQIVESIAEDRRLDTADLRRAIDQSPLLADEAVELGLVDSLGYRDEAYKMIDGKHHLYLGSYLKKTGGAHKKGPRIGVIHGSGTIYRGASGIDPFGGGSSMGSDDVARAFRQAMKDEKLKAIVFRVDSPGGSAVASEAIRRELVRAKETGKPVIVSMGNVAASGGYWISASADVIVAQPGTVTGSIGVVSGKLASREAWAKAGITFDHVGFGDHATYSLGQDGYSDSERRRLEATLDSIYADFTDLVASERNATAERVEENARGRVWTGSQALERGLVDELGGFDRALALAKRAADIDEQETVKLVRYPKKERRFPPPRKDNTEPISDAVQLLATALERMRPAHLEARMPPVWME